MEKESGEDGRRLKGREGKGNWPGKDREDKRSEEKKERGGGRVLRSLRETLRGDRGAIVDIDFMEEGQWIIEGEIYMRKKNSNSEGR